MMHQLEEKLTQIFFLFYFAALGLRFTQGCSSLDLGVNLGFPSCWEHNIWGQWAPREGTEKHRL